VFGLRCSYAFPYDLLFSGRLMESKNMGGTKAKPSQAKPQAKPSQAKPSQAKPSQAKPTNALVSGH
jgi:hypothetical protein